MKKLVLFAPVFFIMNGTSQNLIQSASFLNVSNVSQIQSQQVFASNSLMNSANTVQRRQIITNTTMNNAAPHPMAHQNNFSLNEDVQMQNNSIITENNSENAFGNEMNPLAQIPSLDIPAIQSGNGNMVLNVNLGINMPKLNLKSVKMTKKTSSNSKGSNHIVLNLKKKVAKFNRKAAGKLSFKRKLKIKVDDCFKW